MIKNPKVSVVIPTFNRFEYLIHSLDSVASQTYKNIEIVIVNDGSDDQRYYTDSFKKNKKIVNLEKNQKLIHGFGPGSIRNFGIDVAEGDYIAFLDDDDIWLDHKLEFQIEKLSKSEFKMSNSDAFIGEGKFNSNQRYPSYLYDYYFKKNKERMYGKSLNYYFKKYQYPKYWDFKTLARSNPIITSTVIIEANLLNQMGGFRNLPFAADLDCWKAVLQLTKSIFIDEPLIYYDNNHGTGRQYIK